MAEVAVSGEVTVAHRYRMECMLGGGGMGTVWQARDLVLDRPVAIKSAVGGAPGSEPGSHSAGAQRRLRREAEVLSALSEPRLTRVYDYFEADGQAYIVMELVKGENLSVRLKREGRIPPAEAARIVAQSAEALHAAHRAGVVHRDVKPSNIMLTARGVKLVDFGIAARTHQAEPDTLPSAEVETVESIGCGIAGTPAYIAPERATGAPDSPAADLYALGVVLYQMLSGSLPFRAETPIAMLYAHIAEKPAPMPDDVPAVLAALCLSLLSKLPAERPRVEAVAAACLGFSTLEAQRPPVVPAAAAVSMVPARAAEYADAAVNAGAAMSHGRGSSVRRGLVPRGVVARLPRRQRTNAVLALPRGLS